MRQLRFNYAFPTGYVQPYPLIPPNTLNFPVVQGLAATTTPTSTEILALTSTSQSILPYTVTFTVTNGKYLLVGVPAQFGLIDTFIFNGFPVRWNTVPSNDLDSLADTGTDVGEPYFLYINGVQYAYNLYISEYPQNGTNLTVTVPAQS